LDERKDADNVWARKETKFIGEKNCPRIEKRKKKKQYCGGPDVGRKEN